MTKSFSSISRWCVFTATALVTYLALPRSGHAFEADPTRCYSTAPVWNAKKGVIVTGASPGPIAAVLGAVGETRTHSMISNGDWATHSTTLAPSIQTVSVTVLGQKVGSTPDLNKPLKPVEMAGGSPGFTQINMGGAYAYWQTATQTWTQVSPPLPTAAELLGACGPSCKARGTADWLWSDIPYAASGTMYLLGYNDNGALKRYGYGFHQYMDGGGRVAGVEGENATQRGIVCSQVPPYSYAHWLSAYNPSIETGTGAISPQTYGHDETTNAGVALWYSVYNQCMGDESGFWDDFALSIISFFYGADIQDTACNHAAWQVLNCFFQGEDPNGGGCKSISGTAWNNYAANGSAAGARSLSPEGLLNVNGRTSDRLKAGPWAKWTQGALQWNGGGSTYGCYW